MDHEMEVLRPPESKDKLRRFVGGNLGVRVPDIRVCGHHDAPMDYLWYAYSADFAPMRNKHPQALLEGVTRRVGMNADCVVWANRAGGKTQLAAVASLLEGLFKPGCQTRILAGSLAQSGRMFGYLRNFVQQRFGEHLDGKLLKESCRFLNGSAVEVLSQSARSVRGQHVQKLRCDEVELFDIDVFDAAKFIVQGNDRQVAAMELLSTMHRPYGLMRQVIDDAVENDVPIFKWCVWEVIERCTQERSCSRCPLNDDCGGKARRARGYLRIDDVISQMRRSSRNGFEAEMLCLRPNMANAVFAEFDEREHVRPVGYDASLPLYRAMDFGFTNPFVCLWIQVDGDVVRVIDEYVQKKKIIAEHAGVVKQRTPCEEAQVAGTFVDPAGRARNGVTGTGEVKVLADFGIQCRYRTSEILEGLEQVRAKVRAGDGQSRLVIDPRCTRLIKAMACYHYPESGGELPEKDGENDHLIDALRYFFVNYNQSKPARCGNY